MKQKNNLFNRIIHRRKIKSYTILFKVVTAYSPTDYENFAFEGWICLIANKEPVYFKRIKNKTLHWHMFSWKYIFKKNWKYIGPKKKEYICSWPIGTWYILNYDFLNKIVKVKEWKNN